MKKLVILILLFFVTLNTYCQSDTIAATYLNYTDFREYVQTKVRYPHYAIENGLQGVVKYSIRINKSGCIDSVIFKESPHESFNVEIKKVLDKTKCRFKPAHFHSIPIDIWMDLKAIFVMQI